MSSLREHAAAYGRAIKFSHTAFALPFALAAYVTAVKRYGFEGKTLLGVAAAMVGARSAAMMFNRISDRDVDARNPRTKEREIPSGKISLVGAWSFLIAASTVFAAAAYSLNPLCFALAPLALAVVFGYSLTKRFTWTSHLFLGLALGLAPVGAWTAAAGRLESAPFVWMFAVLTWVAGFDVLYACQDAAFDRESGLHSIPARFGVPTALRAAARLHVFTCAFLTSLHVVLPLGRWHGTGVAAVALLLFSEHAIVRRGGIERIPSVFFNVNAALGVVYFLFVGADALLT